MIGYYDYTVIATYTGLLSSLIGISFALNGNSFLAIIFLMISGVLDMFDGRIASTKKNRTKSEKRFGIQIDSMCDLISFGLFPCAIGYSLGMTSPICFIVMFCYLLCAVIRLSYFNVEEEERQDATNEKRKFYKGLPVTLSAMIFPCIYILNNFIPEIFPYIYTTVMALVAVAFITPFNLKKPDKKELVIISVVSWIILILVIVTRFYANNNA